MLVRGQWANLARITELHPYSFSKDIEGDFFMTTESHDHGLMSHSLMAMYRSFSMQLK